MIRITPPVALFIGCIVFWIYVAVLIVRVMP